MVSKLKSRRTFSCLRRHSNRQGVSRRIVMSATSARLLDKSLRRIPFDKVLAYDEIFERFRKLTTQREYLDLLSNERIVLTCCRYGFAEVSPNATAIRCLCNLLLQVESTRQIFVDGGCPEKAVQRMKVIRMSLADHIASYHWSCDESTALTTARYTKPTAIVISIQMRNSHPPGFYCSVLTRPRWTSMSCLRDTASPRSSKR